jgi:hypothetical protein
MPFRNPLRVGEQHAKARCTAPLTLTLVDQVVPGCDAADLDPPLIVQYGGTLVARAYVDFHHEIVGGGDAASRITVDGVAQQGTAVLNDSAERGLVSMEWRVTVAPKTTPQIALVARKIINAGTVKVRDINTILYVDYLDIGGG